MVTIARILCPTDFSENAEAAATAAVALALRFGARLRFVHVSSPIPIAPFPPEVPVDTRLFDQVRQNADEQLAAVAARARQAGLAVDADHRDGGAAAEVLQAALDFPADLLVLGTHGRSGFDRVALGSVTEKLLRKASCPVVTVPPGVGRDTAVPSFARVLCACDGSPEAQAAARVAASLVRDSAGTLTLLRVVEPVPDREGLSPPCEDAYRHEAEADAARSLREVLSPPERQGYRVDEIVRYGPAPSEILAQAAALGVDLIVLGVRGRGRLDLWMFGSTTHYVVRHARCPVLTVHPTRALVRGDGVA